MTPTFASSLSNQQFALIGLTTEEANEVSAALSQVYATADRVSRDAAQVALHGLAPDHTCIVDASMIDADVSVGGISLSEIEHRQVLAIVDEARLRESDLASAHLEWEVIVRPLRSPELLLRLSRLMSRSREKVDVTRSDKPASHRVLVVDDDETVRALLSGVLEAAGFKCDCVPNASEALAALAGRHHDLVLLDLGMPDMDGFKVLKAMRDHHPVQRPTVIIVTSDKDEDSVLRGFGLGADDYVTKPFNPRELIARCDHAIRNVAKLRDSVVINTLDGLASGGPILGGGSSMFRSA